jgi:hypothetical protein
MQDFGMLAHCVRNNKTSDKTASGSVMNTTMYAKVGKEKRSVCEVNQFSSGNERVSQFSFSDRAGISSALTVIVNEETGVTTCKHPHVVCEDGWVLKNLDIFQKVYLVTDPADVPKWFNDMFLEIMDRLLYDCECDDLPEILVNVRDYISGLSIHVGKE